MPVTNTTPNQGYELPWGGPVPAANSLKFDVGRIINAFMAIDVDMALQIASLAAKAPLASPAFSGVPTAPNAAPGNNTQQLATTAFVAAAVANLVNSSPAALDTLDELAAALGDDANFAATVNAAIAARLIKTNNLSDLTDPATALVNLGANARYPRADAGQTFSPSQKIQLQQNIGFSGAGDRLKNIFINPAMQISQRRAYDTVFNPATNPVVSHAADQWKVHLTSNTAVLNAECRSNSRTPKGSLNRIRISVGTTDTSLASGEFLYVQQAIEIGRMAHLQMGTANAIGVVVQFLFRGPAGTYSACLRSSGFARAYIRTFTITAPQANTDQYIQLSFPGHTADPTSWPTTPYTYGAYFSIWLAAGPSFISPTLNAWHNPPANMESAGTGQSNGLGATNTFELGDFQMHADPNATGVAPAWECPNFEDALFDCMRFWQRILTNFDGNVTSGTNYTAVENLPVPMRGTGVVLTHASLVNTSFPATTVALTASTLTAQANILQIIETRQANASARGIYRGDIIVDGSDPII